MMSAIRFPRLAQMLYDTPLMITPERAAVLEAVFRDLCAGNHTLSVPATTVEEMRQAGGRGTSAKPYVMTDAGFAALPVHGTLMHRGGFMDAESGMSSYSAIGAQFAAAIHDPDVRGVVLDIDSPGGQVAGAFELAKMIRAGSQVKPVYAVANEQATSAAYLIGSAATKFYAPKLASLANIGVMSLHVDRSKAEEKAGLVYTPIFAGSHKTDFSPHAPLSDSARADAQGRIDQMYDHFVNTVAQYRGVSAEAIRKTEARVLSTVEATDLGLIDGMQTLGESLAQIEQHSQGAAATAQSTQEIHMTDQSNAVAKTPEQLASEHNAAMASAAKAATERVKAIMTSDAAKNRGALAQHLAYNTEMSALDAIALLGAAAEEARPAADALAAAMSKVANPTVGADAGGDESMSDEDKAAMAILTAGKRKSLLSVAK